MIMTQQRAFFAGIALLCAGCGTQPTVIQPPVITVTDELRAACTGLGMTDSEIADGLEARVQDRADGYTHAEVLAFYEFSCQVNSGGVMFLENECNECVAAITNAVYGVG
jgi:hypothetical protein